MPNDRRFFSASFLRCRRAFTAASAVFLVIFLDEISLYLIGHWIEFSFNGNAIN